MKKILSILGTISLITSGSSNLIACDNSKAEKPSQGSYLKLISSVLGEGDTEKWYFGIFKKNNKWNIIKWKGNQEFFSYYYDKVYRWEGDGEPNNNMIKINEKTGEIIKWN
ncbi:lipoprotein [Spiroplasma endosymbiont of Polydrusus pterygomalis]|uniref:lipoprotein n=3 Tax=Spiroplasma endosymbiont of Polydrusus pterygomalis TaxID=3139327 RepID=UPI003CCB327C